MTTIAQNPVITLNQKWLEENGNKKAGDTPLQRASDYCASTNGTVRAFQALGKSVKLGYECGIQPTPHTTRLVANLGIATSAIGLARLPTVTQDALDSFSALTDDKNPADSSRKIASGVKNITDAAATYLNAASFITGNSTMIPIAQALDLSSDSAELHLSVSDYTRAAQLELDAPGKVKEAVTHSKNYYLLRLIKAITSVASGIIGLSLLTFGGPLLPSLALIVLSLSTTIFAILKDIYANTGTYNIIKFDRPVLLKQETI